MDVAKVLIKYQVTLPKEVREKLDLSIGERVIFVETEQGILLKKVTPDLINKIKKTEDSIDSNIYSN